MIKVKSARFGEMEVPRNKVITMTGGILGFPNSRRYMMMDHDKDSPFKWIQSMEEPEVAFVVTDPLSFFPNYHIQVKKEELSNLEVKEPSDLVIFVILSLHGEPRDMTANLQGPIIVNADKMVGRQMVLKEGRYSTKHHLFPEIKEKEREKEKERKREEESP